jgi:hypothetical protein
MRRKESFLRSPIGSVNSADKLQRYRHCVVTQSCNSERYNRLEVPARWNSQICRSGKPGEAMRSSSIYNRWTHFIETLRKKWRSLGNGLLQALAEEEIKIRRQELQKELTALNQHE